MLRQMLKPFALGLVFKAPSTLQMNTDRKSTRLNSSHANISYAVFCLKKKKPTQNTHLITTLDVFHP